MPYFTNAYEIKGSIMVSNDVSIKLIRHLIEANEFFGISTEAKEAIQEAKSELEEWGVDVESILGSVQLQEPFSPSFYECERVVFEVAVSPEFADMIRFEPVGPITNMKILEGEAASLSVASCDSPVEHIRYYLVFTPDKDLAVEAEKFQAVLGAVKAEIRVVANHPFKILRKVFI